MGLIPFVALVASMGFLFAPFLAHLSLSVLAYAFLLSCLASSPCFFSPLLYVLICIYINIIKIAIYIIVLPSSMSSLSSSLAAVPLLFFFVCSSYSSVAMPLFCSLYVLYLLVLCSLPYIMATTCIIFLLYFSYLLPFLFSLYVCYLFCLSFICV